MKKALLVVLALVLVAALSVGLTMAYLQDSESVTNTFTVGNVAITLDEADVDDSNNNNSTTDRDKANSYKLIPGKEYVKDPTIHFGENSEPSYLFVKVENTISNLLVDSGENSIAAQLTKNGWIPLGSNANGVYVYAGVTDGTAGAAGIAVTSGADNDYEVFETITVKSNLDDNLTVDQNATITVTGYAVQAEGFNSAETAWAATFGASNH